MGFEKYILSVEARREHLISVSCSKLHAPEFFLVYSESKMQNRHLVVGVNNTE